MRWRQAAVAAWIGLAIAAQAQELPLPKAAEQTRDHLLSFGEYALPVGPADGADLPVQRIEGAIRRQSWRVPSDRLTPLDVIAPIRTTLTAQGYDLMLDCAGPACGGFDFRFGIDVIPAPDMFVNLRDFRFLSAMRGPSEAVGVLVSRSGVETYVQIVHAGPSPAAEKTTEETSEPAAAHAPELVATSVPGTIAQLDARGFAVLDGLEFASGAGALGPGPYPALAALAAYLTDTAVGAKIVIVGHTDNIGSLDANTILSRQRAQAVRTRMSERFGIPAARMQAVGIGYLSPIASNRTEAGRERNRRVEAVLLPE